MDEPGEARFRRLREKPLKQRAGNLLPQCVQLLEASGFAKLTMDGEAVLVLWHDNIDRLQIVLQAVQHQHDIMSR